MVEVTALLRGGVALALAALLGRHGLQKQSLDTSGALAAFVVGFFSLASGYRFGTRPPSYCGIYRYKHH